MSRNAQADRVNVQGAGADKSPAAKQTIRDMTVGKPSKLIIQFMIPMFLGNVFQQFSNVADSSVAARLPGAQAHAGVGRTSTWRVLVAGGLDVLGGGRATCVEEW